jgi:hypothetical protein
MAKKAAIIFITLFLIVGGTLIMNSLYQQSQGTSKEKRFILVGASVGHAWSFSQWPIRMKQTNIICEMIAAYTFDKTEALEEVFMRPKRKFRLTKSYFLGFLKPAPKRPDYVIIKECAAYFPGDQEKYKSLVKEWLTLCTQNNIRPVLATVVPITLEHSQNRPGRLEGILAYNDWVRSYAQSNNIPCLDLEVMLRVNDNQRSLRLELTSGDGLHLNQEAYRILDIGFLNFVERI